jgi:hypothetical protein
MVEQLLINNDDYYMPDASQLVTEDDTLANNFVQKLLNNALHN